MDDVRKDVARILIKEGSDSVTQEQFNAMMDVYLQEQAKKPTSNWAKNVMNWAVSEGIIMGTGNGQLQAQKFITREECITLLQRVFNKLK